MKSFTHSLRKRFAFTIAELLVAAGITGVTTGACMMAFMAFQRCYELSIARSGVRSNVGRFFDALEIDLRNATTLTAGVSGTTNVLPLTITIPQRYSDYEATGPMAGDPERAATRVEPTYDVQKKCLTLPQTVTVTYSLAANDASTRNLLRSITWTPAGGATKTASRIIATVPLDTTITFNSTTGGLLAATDLALVATISAQSNSKVGRTSAPIGAAGTVFLRTKAIK